MIASLRTRRAVFWYLAPDRIVAAVMSRAEREPMLEACAASYAPALAGACFAPGLLEVNWVLGAQRQVHVAALAASYCRIETAGEETETPRRRSRVLRGWRPVRRTSREEAAIEGGSGTLRGVVAGGKGIEVWADEVAVAQADDLFRRARLRLAALDCEPCALASLADALGAGDVDGARRQHLSAVAVMPESESAAEAIGDDLAVPVGLAIAWFGGSRAF